MEPPASIYMASNLTGAELLVRLIEEAGVEICFANPGTTEMQIVGALSNSRVRVVLGLHENVVTGAADGYARMSQAPSMTLLHLGPGLANGIANLHNAKRGGSPVLNVVGTMATWHTAAEAPLKMDVHAIASTVSRWIGTPRTDEDFHEVVNTALHELKCPCLPGESRIVSLMIPHDLQRSLQNHTDGRLTVTKPCQDSAPTFGEVFDKIEGDMRTCDKGAYILGKTALIEPVLSMFAALAATTGAALLCVNGFSRVDRGQGRPKIHRIPYFPDRASSFLQSFSVVVLVDEIAPVAQFGYDDGISSLLPQNCKTHRIGSPCIETMHAYMQTKHICCFASKIERAPSFISTPSGILTSAKMCSIVALLQPVNAIIVDESLTSGTTYWDASEHAPMFSHLTLTGGAIGQGPPCATGAAMACPSRRVINLQADGSGMYTVQSFWTQAKEQLDITTIICANNAYAILQIELQRQKVRMDSKRAAETLTTIDEPPIDWVNIANGFGVPALAVSSCEEFHRALAAALLRPGPFVIVAMLQTGPEKKRINQHMSPPIAPQTGTHAKAEQANSMPVHKNPWNVLQVASDRPAVILKDKTISYAKLHLMVRRVASFFKKHNLERNNCVAVLSLNDWKLLPIYYSASAASLVVLNLNIRLSIKELAYIVEDATPVWIIADDSMIDMARQLEYAKVYSLNELVSLGCEGVPDDDTSLNTVDAPLDGSLLLTSDADYMMYYTSGTTGRPKGVRLTNRNVFTHALNTIKEFEFNSVDVWAHFAPMYHLVDAYAIFSMTWVGGAHVFLDMWDVSVAMSIIERCKVSVTHVSATMLQSIISHSERSMYDFDSIRLISCGGSALPPVFMDEVFRVFGHRFFTSYGMTECCGKISVSRLRGLETNLPRSEQIRLIGSQGRAFTGMKIRIIDKNGKDVATSEVGEVHISGPTLFKGYWHQPEATKSSFTSDGFFKTGDLGKFDEQGWLSLVGRKKEMILFAGENVYPMEVERVIYEHPAVDVAAVIGIPDKTYGELVKAVVQLKEDCALTKEQLSAHCEASLARFKVPAVIDFVSRIPMTGSGKVNKCMLAGRADVTDDLWEVTWDASGFVPDKLNGLDGTWIMISPCTKASETIGKIQAEFEKCKLIVPCSEIQPISTIDCQDVFDSTDSINGVLIILPHGRDNFLNQMQSICNVCSVLADSSQDFTLYVCTCGAFNVQGGDEVVCFEHTAVIGWMRAFGREITQAIKCIDLCPFATPFQKAEQISSVLNSSTVPSELAIRQMNFFEPRISHISSIQEKEFTAFREDCSYVVSGGLGGIGMHVLPWLLNKGVKNLLILSRSQGTIDRSASVLQEWESVHGARIEAHAIDVADASQVFDVFSRILKGWPSCDGIFHLAGALGDCLVKNMTWGGCEKVLSAKAMGALHFHACSVKFGLKLSYFVMFSSIYSLFGYAQLSHYAAANALLDGLAMYRHSRGLPAIAINWGLWRDPNSMAPQNEAFVRYWESQGMKYLTPKDGLNCLDKILRTRNKVVVGAFPVESWSKFCASHHTPSTPLTKAFANIASKCKRLSISGNELQSNRGSIDKSGIETIILEICRSITGETFHMTKSLQTQGIDSLASIGFTQRLSEQLGIILQPSIVFDYPSGAKLAEHLSTHANLKSIDNASIMPEEKSAEDCTQKRCLVLHGEAANADIMRFQMQATGWIDGMGSAIEFVFIDAPHPCFANTSLHNAMYQRGLYDREKEYWGWGLEPCDTYVSPKMSTSDRLQESIQHVRDMVKKHAPIDGICGICDGALLASYIAAQTETADPMTFLFNFCSPPMHRLPPDFMKTISNIQCLNMHFLGLHDELYSQDELLSVPRFSRNAFVYYHEGAHVIPPLLTALRGQVLSGIESLPVQDILRFDGQQAIHCKANTFPHIDDNVAAIALQRTQDLVENSAMDLDSSLMAAGITSLEAIQFASILSDVLKYHVPPTIIFEYATLREVLSAVSHPELVDTQNKYRSQDSIHCNVESMIEIQDFDSNVLGIPTARVSNNITTRSELETVLEHAKSRGVHLLCMSLDAEHPLKKIAESQRVCSKIAYTSSTSSMIKILHKVAQTCDDALKIHEFTPEDKISPELLKLAVITGNHSRFHLDPRLTNKQMAAMFQTWVRNSAKRIAADYMLVATFGNEQKIVGYVTCKIKGVKGTLFGDLTLMACDLNYKHLSITWHLLYSALDWFKSKGIERVEGWTHETNKACRAMYEVAGMKLSQKSHDYHFWVQNTENISVI